MPPWLGHGMEGLSFLPLDTRGKNHFQGEGRPVASGNRDCATEAGLLQRRLALLLAMHKTPWKDRSLGLLGIPW